MDVLETFIAGLLSSGVVVTAAVYLFKVAFEKRMEKEIARFKAELSEKLAGLKAGFALKLEAVRSELKIGEAQEDAKFRQLLDFRARQLSDFYWPLYIGLQKDNVIWRRILDKKDATDELRKRVGGIIERDVILPNHDKLVSLIERNLYLAEADEKLEGLFLAYIRHVAIYRSIRAADEEMDLPTIIDGGEWPHDLFPSVERRMRELREDYNRLLRAQEKAGSPVGRAQDVPDVHRDEPGKASPVGRAQDVPDMLHPTGKPSGNAAAPDVLP